MINIKATYTPMTCEGKLLKEEPVLILEHTFDAAGAHCFLAVKLNGQFFIDNIGRFTLLTQYTGG